jgi:HEPN domain-containing protein
MSRKKQKFTTEHVAAFFAKLKDIRDIELLILKAQAGFEQLLFTAVAARLNVPTDELSPRLQFRMLVDLALVGSHQPRFAALLEKFAGVRNAFAHELDPDPAVTSRALEEFVDLTHSWADEEREKHASLGNNMLDSAAERSYSSPRYGNSAEVVRVLAFGAASPARLRWNQHGRYALLDIMSDLWEFAHLLLFLQVLQSRFLRTDDTLSAVDIEDATKFFVTAQRICHQHGFSHALLTTEHVIGSAQSVGTKTLPEGMTASDVGGRLDQFDENFRHDLFSRSVEIIPASKNGFYGASFGSDVDIAFPSSIEDAREANTCYALGRNRAAVFHAVRAAEWGLKALARAAGVTGRIDYKEWGKILNAIEQKVAPVDRWKTGPEKSNALNFYRGALAEARAINNCWRTATMHVKAGQPCDESDAKKALDRTGEFLRRLSMRVSETQKRPLAKRSFAK